MEKGIFSVLWNSFIIYVKFTNGTNPPYLEAVCSVHNPRKHHTMVTGTHKILMADSSIFGWLIITVLSTAAYSGLNRMYGHLIYVMIVTFSHCTC